MVNYIQSKRIDSNVSVKPLPRFKQNKKKQYKNEQAKIAVSNCNNHHPLVTHTNWKPQSSSHLFSSFVLHTVPTKPYMHTSSKSNLCLKKSAALQKTV